MLIDITTFRLKEGASKEAFLASDVEVQAELSPRKGFVRRTTASGSDRTWLVLTFWYDAECADAEAVRLPEGADPTTVTTERFTAFDL